MAKHIWFSKPCAAQWDCHNEFYRKHKCSVDEFYASAIKNTTNPFSSYQNNQLMQFIWQLWLADAKSRMLHLFFMDKSLRDWLADLPLHDLNGIKKYIADNGIATQQGLLALDNFYFGIHIPFENKYRGYAFHLMNNQLNQMVLTWSYGKDCEKSGWVSGENYKILNDENENERFMSQTFRLAINTIAYMEAFPECIKDGVPPEIKEPNLKNSFSVQIAEKVKPSIEALKNPRTLSPHRRRGYFKRLESDFYTHKKGQLIFVSETMVNGNAKTVYPTEKTDITETLT